MYRTGPHSQEETEPGILRGMDSGTGFGYTGFTQTERGTMTADAYESASIETDGWDENSPLHRKSRAVHILIVLAALLSILMMGSVAYWHFSKTRTRPLDVSGIKDPRIQNSFLQAKKVLDSAADRMEQEDYDKTIKAWEDAIQTIIKAESAQAASAPSAAPK